MIFPSNGFDSLMHHFRYLCTHLAVCQMSVCKVIFADPQALATLCVGMRKEDCGHITSQTLRR